MSPRKNHRPKDGPPSARKDGGSGSDSESRFGSASGFGGFERTEEHPDGEWNVRMVSGVNATKPYRCPGCDQEIPAGVPHLVAWPAESGGADDRRHWHRPCWQARLRRAPRTQRTRNAPRY